MQETIFSRIISGEIPSYKVYEDAQTLAFLDIHPVQPGHTLIVPKKQVEFLWDLDDEDYLAVMTTVKLVARQLRQALNSLFIGEKVEGIDIPHAHVHVIPFTTIDQFRRLPDMLAEPNHAELAEMAKKLAF